MGVIDVEISKVDACCAPVREPGMTAPRPEAACAVLLGNDRSSVAEAGATLGATNFERFTVSGFVVWTQQQTPPAVLGRSAACREQIPRLPDHAGKCPDVNDTPLSRLQAFVLFAIVVLAWGLIWPVTKVLVESVPPLWTTALRCWIALAALVVILGATRNLVVPAFADAPVVASIALLHMVGFSVLMAAGLSRVPASKAIVLGYTTPLWVTLLAPVFLRERITPGRLAGAALGLAGLAVLLNPLALDWTDRRALAGYGYIVAAAMLWALSIVYARKHRWIATPLQLLPWQIALAGMVLTPLALMVEGVPDVAWTPTLVSLFVFAGLVGTALGYWAMSMVNRSLPALTTSLGITATPIVGIAGGALLLGERLDASLLVAAALIIGGIAANSVWDRR